MRGFGAESRRVEGTVELPDVQIAAEFWVGITRHQDVGVLGAHERGMGWGTLFVNLTSTVPGTHLRVGLRDSVGLGHRGPALSLMGLEFTRRRGVVVV